MGNLLHGPNINTQLSVSKISKCRSSIYAWSIHVWLKFILPTYLFFAKLFSETVIFMFLKLLKTKYDYYSMIFLGIPAL